MSADSALADFLRDLRRLDRTRNRMEKLFGDRRITLTDLHSVYEALFLRAVTSFEGFLESLFIAIMIGRKTYTGGRVGLRMTVQTKEALMKILLQGDKYMNWIPYKNTEDRANIYLKNGKPFSDLTSNSRGTITTITTIRNAIAHKSKHAMGEFDKKVIGNANLLRGERRPAGYLRSQVRTNPTQNRFEVYAAELARIAADLC